MLLIEPPMRAHLGGLRLDPSPVAGQVELQRPIALLHESLRLVQLLGQTLDLIWAQEVLETSPLQDHHLVLPEVHYDRHPLLHAPLGIEPALMRRQLHLPFLLLQPPGALRVWAPDVLKDLLLHLHELSLAFLRVFLDPVLDLVLPGLVEVPPND